MLTQRRPTGERTNRRSLLSCSSSTRDKRKSWSFTSVRRSLLKCGRLGRFAGRSVLAASIEDNELTLWDVRCKEGRSERGQTEGPSSAVLHPPGTRGNQGVPLASAAPWSDHKYSLQ